MRFLGAVSRDGDFATGGVILIGFFADFGGSLEWGSDRGRLLVQILDSQRDNGIIDGILEHVVV